MLKLIFAWLSSDETFLLWLSTITIGLTIEIGYYTYLKIKREFDQRYRAKNLLFKRLANGVAYFLFLLLLREAVTLQLSLNPATKMLVDVFLILTAGIGVFLIFEIIVSSYNLLRFLREKRAA